MIKDLRFWVQKVLPLVYDDSLSYYELLCKVVDKLNDVIKHINTSEENIYSVVSQILNEWIEDGTLEDLINDEVLGNLEQRIGAGGTANVRPLMTSFYPYPTSTGARPDVVPRGSGAYYVQGMACTPNGFAFVRLAPETNKINNNDVSQIFEFSKTGTYIRSAGVDVHHGNGMCYYDGYLYCDVGNNVAKIRYSDFTIVGYVNLGGSCPALDKENKVIYSIDTGSKYLYKYDLTTEQITSIALEPDCPAAYNGSMYKDGVFYAITYRDDLIMFDVETGKCLGGKHVQHVDTNNISLHELEDMDVDEDGNCYVISNQTQYSTDIYSATREHLTLRRAGFYIGQLYLDGSGSSLHTVDKPNRSHATGVIVKNDVSLAEEMNAKIELGTADYPFRSFASASFLNADVREINAVGYTTMIAGDIYQPIIYSNYALISNLTVRTTYPLAIKGWTGYIKGGEIYITNWGITLAYCDIRSVDINVDESTGDCIGVLYNGIADLTVGSDSVMPKTYIYVFRAELDGSNAIPVGQCTSRIIKYTNQSGVSGESVTICTPLIGGARGSRIGLLDVANTKYVIYNLTGAYLYGTDGSRIAVTDNNRQTGELTFVAPFNFDRVDVL